MKTKKARMLTGILAVAVCAGWTVSARAFWTDGGQAGGALEQLGVSAGPEAGEAVAVPAVAEVRAVQASAGEKEINGFLDRAVKAIMSSDDPRSLEKPLKAETEAMMGRADSPGAVMTLMIFRDKNIADLIEEREQELYKKKTSAMVRAEQAAAELRKIAAEEKASNEILQWIRSVTIEKDILGRPRLKILAQRPLPAGWKDSYSKVIYVGWTKDVRAYDLEGREKPLSMWVDVRDLFRIKDKFEEAVAWNFSDYPQPHPMSGFGIGYRIEYDDTVPGAENR